MKNICILLFLLAPGTSYGQIQSVTLQASGLTCSMCSRAIYKALQKLPEVAVVQEDIEHTSYYIQFKTASDISPEHLKKAVNDAGFSVAWMEVNAHFNVVSVATDSSLKLDGILFHFVDTKQQTLSGERKLLILDKDYLLDKDRKKYAGTKDLQPAISGGNSFHVTILQS